MIIFANVCWFNKWKCKLKSYVSSSDDDDGGDDDVLIKEILVKQTMNANKSHEIS